jgi:hypothetical protein
MHFEPTTSPFKFRRTIAEDFHIELDLLSEPEVLQDIPAQFVSVQNDLNALIIRGSSLVFAFNFEAEAEGKLMDGSELSTKLRVADIVSMIGLKGHALGRPLKLEKDCYDVYAICGFTGGSPMRSAQEYVKRFSASSAGKRERDFVRQALKNSGVLQIRECQRTNRCVWVLRARRFQTNQLLSKSQQHPQECSTALKSRAHATTLA